MVAKQIMRELSQMLITDTVLQYAVLPEGVLGADRYMSSVTTISDVEVSSDLQVILCNSLHIFCSIDDVYGLYLSLSMIAEQ